MKIMTHLYSIMIILSAVVSGICQNNYLINSEISNLRSRGFTDFSEPGLVRILNDPAKSAYHQTALRLIALKGFRNAGPELIKYYRNCNYEACGGLLKIKAASTLVQIGDSTGLKFLHELLNKNQSKPDRLMDVVGELSGFGDNYCINSIRRLLKDKEWSRRLGGIRCASKLVGFGKGKSLLAGIDFLSRHDANKLVRTESLVLKDEIRKIPAPYYEIPIGKVIDESKRICEQNGWKWDNDYIVGRGPDRFVVHIWGKGSKNGVYITIDKKTGKVLKSTRVNK